MNLPEDRNPAPPPIHPPAEPSVIPRCSASGVHCSTRGDCSPQVWWEGLCGAVEGPLSPSSVGVTKGPEAPNLPGEDPGKSCYCFPEV